jgi:hypothetical protein
MLPRLVGYCGEGCFVAGWVVRRGKEIPLKDVEQNRYQVDKPTKKTVDVGETEERGRTSVCVMGRWPPERSRREGEVTGRSQAWEDGTRERRSKTTQHKK